MSLWSREFKSLQFRMTRGKNFYLKNRYLTWQELFFTKKDQKVFLEQFYLIKNIDYSSSWNSSRNIVFKFSPKENKVKRNFILTQNDFTRTKGEKENKEIIYYLEWSSENLLIRNKVNNLDFNWIRRVWPKSRRKFRKHNLIKKNLESQKSLFYQESEFNLIYWLSFSSHKNYFTSNFLINLPWSRFSKKFKKDYFLGSFLPNILLINLSRKIWIEKKINPIFTKNFFLLSINPKRRIIFRESQYSAEFAYWILSNGFNSKQIIYRLISQWNLTHWGVTKKNLKIINISNSSGLIFKSSKNNLEKKLKNWLITFREGQNISQLSISVKGQINQKGGLRARSLKLSKVSSNKPLTPNFTGIILYPSSYGIIRGLIQIKSAQ